LGKKVVFIMNSIKAIKKISLTLEKFKIPHDVLHSELDMYDRRKVEAKIADNDFGILVSNQMISHSLDIDASVMFIECPDSLAHLVQILGRCNRLKKEIFGTNLYVFNIDEGELFQEFSRTLALPVAVKEDGVKAELKDGVLTITFEKVKQEKATKIPVL
jgi:CRISPR/Cas system-associated endonuclease/helicase Cas3